MNIFENFDEILEESLMEGFFSKEKLSALSFMNKYVYNDLSGLDKGLEQRKKSVIQKYKNNAVEKELYMNSAILYYLEHKIRILRHAHSKISESDDPQKCKKIIDEMGHEASAKWKKLSDKQKILLKKHNY